MWSRTKTNTDGSGQLGEVDVTENADERYEEVVRQHVQKTWNEGNYETLDDHFAVDVSVIQYGSSQRGRDHVKELIEHHRAGFPDLRLERDKFRTENDTAVLYWTFSGTHSGTWFGISPTGTTIEFSGKTLLQFIGDSITTVHGLPNRIQILRELGVLL